MFISVFNRCQDKDRFSFVAVKEFKGKIYREIRSFYSQSKRSEITCSFVEISMVSEILLLENRLGIRTETESRIHQAW